MMGLGISLVGALLIAATLREMFRDLFQPSGSGALSSFVASTIFSVARRLRALLSVAGPLTIVVVITIWALFLALGFALLYLPHYPAAFTQSGPTAQSTGPRFLTVFYLSLSALTTLGSGQITPQPAWIRIVYAFESLIGISLITASVTWIVLLYPALRRMRALARRASVLDRAQQQTGTDALDVGSESLLADLAENVIRTRIDFIHFPLIYYFHSDTEGASLARSRLSTISPKTDRAPAETSSCNCLPLF